MNLRKLINALLLFWQEHQKLLRLAMTAEMVALWLTLVVVFPLPSNHMTRKGWSMQMQASLLKLRFHRRG